MLGVDLVVSSAGTDIIAIVCSESRLGNVGDLSMTPLEILEDELWRGRKYTCKVQNRLFTLILSAQFFDLLKRFFRCFGRIF